MFGYVILAFVLYFLYRFVSGFLLPIWRSTKAVRQNIRNMNMQQDQPASHAQAPGSSDKKIKTFTEKAGDYIDFEEIKEGK